MNLTEKQAQLVHRLLALPNGQDRLTYLLGVARDRPSLPPEDRLDSCLVPGCLAKLWFIPSFSDGCCHFRCDSDSLVVKAIAGLLCEFYSGQTPAEILAHDPDRLGELNARELGLEYFKDFAGDLDGLIAAAQQLAKK